MEAQGQAGVRREGVRFSSDCGYRLWACVVRGLCVGCRGPSGPQVLQVLPSERRALVGGRRDCLIYETAPSQFMATIIADHAKKKGELPPMSTNPFHSSAPLDPRSWCLPSRQLEPATPGSAAVGLGRRLCIPANIVPAEAHQLDEDDIDDSDDDGSGAASRAHVMWHREPCAAPAFGLAARPTTAGKSFADRLDPPQQGAKRSSFVSHLSLRGAQLGQTVAASASGRTGSRRDLGPHQANAYRAANQHQDDARTLRVRFGINGGAPATDLQLRSSMSEVRHKVLRLIHVRSASPVVIADCEHDDSAEDMVRVVMQPAAFQRACGSGGRRFVIFGPWSERTNGSSTPILLVSYAEALPSGLVLNAP